jgi:NADH-quinone oxidoreductase subunit C
MRLNESQIGDKIKAQFPDLAIEWTAPENGDKALVVPADKIDVLVAFLKSAPELSFDFLMSVSAFDRLKYVENGNDIELTYHFYSYQHRHAIVLKARVPRQNGSIKSLTALYGCADFQEREVFDHFGVTFEGHPNLRRILLPDDWVGYPLLKDYKEEEEYNGIATTRPSLL